MKLNEMKKGRSVADLGIKYEGSNFMHGGNFFCMNKNLTSLEGSPRVVTGAFDCSHNDLTSLKGAPREVGDTFWAVFNKLTSLEGAPQKVGKSFLCGHNNLTSLEGAPPEVSGNFNCSHNELTSLKGIHKIIKRIGVGFGATGCRIQSHVLGLLLIKDLQEVELDNKELQAIINRHLDGGSMKSAMNCQHELIKEGYTEFAKL